MIGSRAVYVLLIGARSVDKVNIPYMQIVLFNPIYSDHEPIAVSMTLDSFLLCI